VADPWADDPTAVVEFTDWQRVEAFGRRLAAM